MCEEKELDYFYDFKNNDYETVLILRVFPRNELGEDHIKWAEMVGMFGFRWISDGDLWTTNSGLCYSD